MSKIEKLDLSVVQQRDISKLYEKTNEIIDVLNHNSFKPIVIFYVGIKKYIRKKNDKKYIRKKKKDDLRKTLKNLRDTLALEDFHTIIIPNTEKDDISTECIYPKEIDEDVEKQINELKEKLDEFINV